MAWALRWKDKKKTPIRADLQREAMTCVVLDEQGAVRVGKETANKRRKQVADYFGSYGLHAKGTRDMPRGEAAGRW